VFLRLQRGLDRLVRQARVGTPPERTGRRFVAIQIDGLAATVLDRALAEGRMPYGIGAPEGNVSYIPERGAHAGASGDELHTFLIHSPGVAVLGPIQHPLELYDPDPVPGRSGSGSGHPWT
jgi:hypothetical protein